MNRPNLFSKLQEEATKLYEAHKSYFDKNPQEFEKLFKIEAHPILKKGKTELNLSISSNINTTLPDDVKQSAYTLDGILLDLKR